MERRGFLRACAAAALGAFLRIMPPLAGERPTDGAVWFEPLREAIEQDFEGPVFKRIYRTSDPRGKLLIACHAPEILLRDPRGMDILSETADQEARYVLGLIA